MYTKIQITFDAADPEKLAAFWKIALDYDFDAPPPGYASWADLLRERGIPEDQWGDASALVDPLGEGPRIYFQRVPEGKTAKNRVHLDVRVAGPGTRDDERQRLVDQHVSRLLEAGATIAWRTDDPRGQAVVMRDPEGNEFCVT